MFSSLGQSGSCAHNSTNLAKFCKHTCKCDLKSSSSHLCVMNLSVQYTESLLSKYWLIDSSQGMLFSTSQQAAGSSSNAPDLCSVCWRETHSSVQEISKLSNSTVLALLARFSSATKFPLLMNNKRRVTALPSSAHTRSGNDGRVTPRRALRTLALVWMTSASPSGIYLLFGGLSIDHAEADRSVFTLL